MRPFPHGANRDNAATAHCLQTVVHQVKRHLPDFGLVEITGRNVSQLQPDLMAAMAGVSLQQRKKRFQQPVKAAALHFHRFVFGQSQKIADNAVNLIHLSDHLVDLAVIGSKQLLLLKQLQISPYHGHWIAHLMTDADSHFANNIQKSQPRHISFQAPLLSNIGSYAQDTDHLLPQIMLRNKTDFIESLPVAAAAPAFELSGFAGSKNCRQRLRPGQIDVCRQAGCLPASVNCQAFRHSSIQQSSLIGVNPLITAIIAANAVRQIFKQPTVILLTLQQLAGTAANLHLQNRVGFFQRRLYILHFCLQPRFMFPDQPDAALQLLAHGNKRQA